MTFRQLLSLISNKWILGAVLLMLIIAGGCYFYYTYTITQHKKAAAELDELVRQWEKNQKAQQKSSTETQKTLTDIHAESNTPQNTEKHVTNANLVTKKTAATPGQTGTAAEKTETVEVHMSPHGLGPYPEVPDDYRKQCGLPPWEAADLLGTPPPHLEVELIARVNLKLWKEGNTQVRGGIFENGKVYINYRNHAYVRWTDVKNADGTTSRALTLWRTSGDIPSPTRKQMHNGYIPPGVSITDLDVEDPGIEPYSFLGLGK